MQSAEPFHPLRSYGRTGSRLASAGAVIVFTGLTLSASFWFVFALAAGAVSGVLALYGAVYAMAGVAYVVQAVGFLLAFCGIVLLLRGEVPSAQPSGSMRSFGRPGYRLAIVGAAEIFVGLVLSSSFWFVNPTGCGQALQFPCTGWWVLTGVGYVAQALGFLLVFWGIMLLLRPSR